MEVVGDLFSEYWNAREPLKNKLVSRGGQPVRKDFGAVETAANECIPSNIDVVDCVSPTQELRIPSADSVSGVGGMKLAINGFARIGGAVARIIAQREEDLQIVPINVVVPHQVRHDMTMDKWDETGDAELLLNGESSKVLGAGNTTGLPCRDTAVPVPSESSGMVHSVTSWHKQRLSFQENTRRTAFHKKAWSTGVECSTSRRTSIGKTNRFAPKVMGLWAATSSSRSRQKCRAIGDYGLSSIEAWASHDLIGSIEPRDVNNNCLVGFIARHSNLKGGPQHGVVQYESRCCSLEKVKFVRGPCARRGRPYLVYDDW